MLRPCTSSTSGTYLGGVRASAWGHVSDLRWSPMDATGIWVQHDGQSLVLHT